MQRFTLADARRLKVGVWDTETTNFSAHIGLMLNAGVMPLFGSKKDVKTWRIDQYRGYNKARWDDTRLVEEVIAELNTYDVLIGHNSVDFDTKFINSRALDNRTRWIRQDIKHVDTRRMCKKFLRFGYRSLDNLSIFLATKDRKTPLIAKLWKRAMTGDTAALDEIIVHNRQDIITLEEIVRIVLPFLDNGMPYEFVR